MPNSLWNYWSTCFHYCNLGWYILCAELYQLEYASFQEIWILYYRLDSCSAEQSNLWILCFADNLQFTFPFVLLFSRRPLCWPSSLRWSFCTFSWGTYRGLYTFWLSYSDGQSYSWQIFQVCPLYVILYVPPIAQTPSLSHQVLPISNSASLTFT